MDRGSREATELDPTTMARTRVRLVRLRITSGPDAGRSIDVPSEGLVIGSQLPAEVALRDPGVSRRHAEIRRAANGWVLADLGSTNGTWIAELRVDAVYLGAGTLFRVGRTTIAFESREEDVRLEAPAADDPAVVAASPPMRELLAAVRKFGPTDLSVVLEGETGSGKEVIARALHRSSRRADRPIRVVDCGTLHENLVESELFGHERGSFTGATEARTGAFEEADGGTLFLDEVGELPIALQPKLLRVLESREVRRLGASRVRTVDVRVIAATNRNLPEEIAAKRFRADLFFRLSEVRLRVPALRDRPEDVEPLARRFATAVDPSATFEPEAIATLRARAWPGNVRELGNAVRRAVVAAEGRPVGAMDLPPADLPRSAAGPSLSIDVDLPVVAARDAVVAAFYRAYFGELLERYGGDLDAVARHAGMHVQSVRRLIRGAREE